VAVTPKQQSTFLPNKMEEKLEVATQLVGLYCPPMAALLIISPSVSEATQIVNIMSPIVSFPAQATVIGKKQSLTAS
jgi:hypothetical protein